MGPNTIQKSVIHTQDVDSLRNMEYIQSVKKGVSNQIGTIISLNSLEQVISTVEKYFSAGKYTSLATFFKKHPHSFLELIRKIHSLRKNDSEHGGWYIPSDKISTIARVFLFRNRTPDIGKKINEYIEHVCSNQKFIGFCSEQPSVLDYNSYDFSQLKPSTRKMQIKNLIEYGLISNIDGCNHENIHDYFTTTKPRILHYLDKIYGVQTGDLEWCRNISQLTDELEKKFKCGRGSERKYAWKVVQAFTAWGNITNIEEKYAITKENITRVPKKLIEKGILIDENSIRMKRVNDIDTYEATWKFEGLDITISWRAKQPKSILKKLWETEEYTSDEAIMDEVGLSFSYPDSITEKQKASIMQMQANLMPDHGYILKDKGEIGNDIQSIINLLGKNKKNPAFFTTARGASTDSNMKNMSMTGFMKLGDQNVGFEIQSSTKSAMEWKKQDDILYKPKGAAIALMRGAYQATPREFFNMLTREVNPENFGMPGIIKINEFMLNMIQQGFIRPYVSEDGTKVLLTLPLYEQEFLKRWDKKKLELCTDSSHRHYPNLVGYISSLEITH